MASSALFVLRDQRATVLGRSSADKCTMKRKFEEAVRRKIPDKRPRPSSSSAKIGGAKAKQSKLPTQYDRSLTVLRATVEIIPAFVSKRRRLWRALVSSSTALTVLSSRERGFKFNSLCSHWRPSSGRLCLRRPLAHLSAMARIAVSFPRNFSSTDKHASQIPAGRVLSSSARKASGFGPLGPPPLAPAPQSGPRTKRQSTRFTSPGGEWPNNKRPRVALSKRGTVLSWKSAARRGGDNADTRLRA